MKKVGFWVSESKEKRLEMEKFAKEYRSDDLEFVKLDLNNDLNVQGPFDLIVHKFLDLIVKQNFGCRKSANQMTNFKIYYDEHRETIMLDPLERMPVMLDRYMQNLLTNTVVQHSNLRMEIFAPPFCRLESNNISDCVAKCEAAGLEFPIVCKPEIAHGHNMAHEMCLVFNKDGLKDIEAPCVAQTFINHNARLYKIFAVGDQIFICNRPSLKNFSAGSFSTLFFNTNDVSKEESKHELTELDEENVNIPEVPTELFQEVARIYCEESGLSLLGIDLILCNNSSKYAIIDANIFPGYEKMPNFYKCLEFLIRKKLNLPQRIHSNDFNNAF